MDEVNGHSNFLPALAKVGELLQLGHHDECALSVFFFSDGRSSDHKTQGISADESYEKMKEEHTEMPDSNQQFTTGCAHHHTHSPPLHSALSLPTFRNECP